MPHTVSITDGTTTFALSGNVTAMLQNYAMATPSTGDQSVTETIKLAIVGSTPAAMQTNVATLERLLQQARQRRTRNVGPFVYLVVQLISDAAAWRSRILDARLELSETSLAVWGNAICECSLLIERAPYWEGALTQLPLTNGNGTNNTSGLKIYNCGDSTGTSPNKRDNYVQVAANDVTGSLPAPVRLELTNTIGSSIQFSALYAATNAFADPQNFAHIQEAESIIVSGSLSALDASLHSGGYYVVNSIVGAGTLTIQATLSAALLAKCAGQDFHILQRTSNFPAGYVRASVYDAAGNAAIRHGDEIAASVASNLYDLGVLSLPPGGYSSAYGALRMVTRWRVSGSTDVQTDYWALFPTTGFRRLQAIADVVNNATVVDDPIEDRAFVLSSGAELPYIVRRAGPVMVWPGQLQRVYFLWAGNSGISTITQTMTVKAYYRPRRVTIG